jgi:hypothetical protein
MPCAPGISCSSLASFDQLGVSRVHSLTLAFIPCKLHHELLNTQWDRPGLGHSLEFWGQGRVPQVQVPMKDDPGIGDPEYAHRCEVAQ